MHQSANVTAAVGTVYPDQQANAAKYIQFASTSFHAITVIAFGEMKEREISHPTAEQTTLSLEWTPSSETFSPMTLGLASNFKVDPQSRRSLAGKSARPRQTRPAEQSSLSPAPKTPCILLNCILGSHSE